MPAIYVPAFTTFNVKLMKQKLAAVENCKDHGRSGHKTDPTYHWL